MKNICNRMTTATKLKRYTFLGEIKCVIIFHIFRAYLYIVMVQSITINNSFKYNTFPSYKKAACVKPLGERTENNYSTSNF